MNYVDLHQSKDERPLASDGSQAWLAALAALPREELTRMANAIELNPISTLAVPRMRRVDDGRSGYCCSISNGKSNAA